MSKKRSSYPIRLIRGIGNNLIQGVALVYERPDGSVGKINLWFHRDDFSHRTKFTDEQPEVTLETVTRDERTLAGIFNGEKERVTETRFVSATLPREHK